jgi:peptide/nickel transport system substrate-binding protein
MAEQNAEDLERDNVERWRHMFRTGKLSRREFTRVIALLAGAGVGMLGRAAAFTPLPAHAVGPAAKGKDTLVTAMEADLPTLDPHMNNLRPGIIFHYHLYDNLVARNLATMKIGPHLATSWKPIEPTVWEMELRQDVKFTNGEPFNAEVVKFNWDRVLDPNRKSPQRGNHRAIKSVHVTGPHKVRVTTTAPYPVFAERLQNFQMIPPKYVREKGDAYFAEHPIGTGPYKLLEWKRDQYIALERNDGYWGPKPAIKNVTFRIIPDKATQIGELLAGRMDVMRAVPTDQTQTVNASGIASVLSERILRVEFIRLDAKGRWGPNPFQDKRVRQAVNHAINIDAYIKNLQPGGDRTAALISPMQFGYSAAVKPYEYSPERAKSLLAQAGHGNGFSVRALTSSNQLMPNARLVEQAVQQDLAKVGIKIEIQVMGASAFEDLVAKGQAGPMYFYNWGSYSIFDVDGMYWDMLHSSSVHAYWENKDFDKLIEEGRGSLNAEVRRKAYAQAQAIVREEAPAAFMWAFHQLWGVSKTIAWKPAPDEIDRYFEAKPA